MAFHVVQFGGRKTTLTFVFVIITYVNSGDVILFSGCLGNVHPYGAACLKLTFVFDCIPYKEAQW